MLLGALGCPPPEPRPGAGYVSVDRTIGNGDEAPGGERLRSDDQQANRRFAAAVERWTRGEYREAGDAFRLFLVDFPDDPLAPRAEAYLGRTLLARDAVRDARAVFESLAARDDRAAHNAGLLYLAFADQTQLGRTEAVRRLARAVRDPASFYVPTALIVEGDGALLGVIAYKLGESIDAPLLAIDAAGVVYATAVDPALRAWAIGAATTLARESMTGQQLVDCLSLSVREMAPPPNAPVGLCATVLVERYLDVGDRESAAIAMERGGQALMRAGLEDLFAQTNRLLSETGADQSLRYGVVLSLTGPDQRAGRAALGGVLLATRAFQRSEAISEVVIEDTGGTEEGSRRAAQAAIARGAKLLIGPIEPPLARAAQEVARQEAVPFISLAANYSIEGEPTQTAEHAWQLTFSPAAEARVIVERLNAEQAPGVALVGSGRDLPYLSAFERAVEEEIRALGGTITGRFSLVGADGETAQQTSRRIAREIASARPSAIVFATTASETATLTAWLADNGLWPRGSSRSGRSATRYFGNSFVWSDDLVRNSESYVQGMLLPVWFDPAIARRDAEQFTQAFERTYGRPPSAVEAFAFDAASVARALLVEEGLRSSDRIAERLAQNVEFHGVTGTLAFGDSSTAVATPELVRIDGRQLREVGADE